MVLVVWRCLYRTFPVYPTVSMGVNGESKALQRLRTNPRLVGESWDYFGDWLDGKDSGTQESYLKKFVQFLEFEDTDTEALFSEYRDMVGDADPRTKKRMGRRVTAFQKKLIADGLKGASTHGVYKSVKAFFKSNELDFAINGERVTDDSESLPSISKIQLRRVLESTGSYRVKALINLTKDSGLRIGDITHLTVGDIRNAYRGEGVNGGDFLTFEVETEKTGSTANPVLGPETIQALDRWTEEREKLGISAEDSDILFCCVKTVQPFTDRRGREVTGSTKGDLLKDATLGTIFKSLVRKAGLRPLSGEKRTPSIHSLRKYHKTSLEFAGCPVSWINKMQGRKGEGTGGIYTKPSPTQLIEIYSGAYSALSLSQDFGDSERESLREVREDFAESKKQAQQLYGFWTESQDEKKALEERVKRLEEMLKRIEGSL